MPELPEVEFCGHALERWTKGRRVVALTLHDPRSVRASTRARPTDGLPDAAERLAEVMLERSPEPPERHGKRLLWRFGRNAVILHLGMTGKWTRRDHPHKKLSLTLSDGQSVHFCDPRLLGGLVPCLAEEGPKLLVAGLGPDAFLEALPSTGASIQAIKVRLMDQAWLAGLGNLHAAEALWRAGIHPSTPAAAVTGKRHSRLARGIRDQLFGALQAMAGDDEIYYVEDRGAPNPFPLYQRAGQPCPRCSTPIERMIHAARSTWWCPACQQDGADELGSARRPSTG